MFLEAEHPSRPGVLNKERTKTDILDHKKALRCFAAGLKGYPAATNEVPLSSLEGAEELMCEHVRKGISLLALPKGEPSSKTISNLVSCFKRVRVAALKLHNVPREGRSARKLLDALPKRRIRLGFRKDAWPERFKREFAGYREWKVKPVLSKAEGREFRKQPCRPITIDKKQVSDINRMVGYMVRERGVTDFGLVDICDPELFIAYLNWHLSQNADGGYVTAKHTSIALALISRYLVATGQLEQRRDGKDIWQVFYQQGQDVVMLGANRGEVNQPFDIGNWKPIDLRRLGYAGWTIEAPVPRNVGKHIHNNAIFSRKRSALFFFLAYETPLRVRNWREMQWGKNLYRSKDGRWTVHFEGSELKIGRRGYFKNVYERTYSQEASRMIDGWRIVLAEKLGPDFETLAPYVFTPNKIGKGVIGKPISYGSFSRCLKCLVMEIRGETFHPHMVRHIVGSYFVNEYGAGGFGLAAELLGDTIEIVLKSYYRPNTKKDFENYLKLAAM